MIIYKRFRIIRSKSNVGTFSSFHVIDIKQNNLHYICINYQTTVNLYRKTEFGLDAKKIHSRIGNTVGNFRIRL